jgi:hypothetical protein
MRAAERCTAGSGPEVAPFQLQTSPASAAARAVNELTRTINAPKPKRTVKFVHHSLQKVTNHRPAFFATKTDGKYLIKGGGPKVWKRFRLRKEHRRLQGIIHGKRCGTTQNIGSAARHRDLDADEPSGRRA